MRAALAAVACAGVLLAGKSAQAHPEDDLPAPPVDEPPPAIVDDPSFGPLLEIEAIEIEGNEWSADRVILRALPVHPGDVLRAGDPRLQKARFKLLALGFFRDVGLTLKRGSTRGKVVLVVVVVERGTVILNQLHFGTSSMTPGWVGADVTERNFLGTGVGVGAGAVWAADGDIAGQRAQWAGEARFADESVLGTPLGVHAGFLYRRASEPFRISGDEDDDGPEHFNAFPYSRTGGAAGVSMAVTPLARFAADVRFEHVRASPPASPMRTLPDGDVVPVDLHMPAGGSRLVGVSRS
jgi:outer membrane protein assembly factor BamA